MLQDIYKEHSRNELEIISSNINLLIEKSLNKKLNNNASSDIWDSSTVVLITYADTVQRKEEFTLRTLREFINNQLYNLSSIVHVLPFLSSTSDGGFAVASFEEVETHLGDWNDLKELSKNRKLMADLVVNHISSSHPWVNQFIHSNVPGKNFIISPIKESGWDIVVRPRNSSLFTNFNTVDGLKKVWTTFGPDQVDLNWKNPYILVEFVKVILRYFKFGISWLRLDAIAFIWKEKGTTCLNLDEVHKIVKILRYIIDNLSGKNILITETNLPQGQNLSYLIDGNESHIAYNFSLPPLLLECLFSSNADLLNKWLSNFPKLPSGTTLLNFSSSHDGIGLRPLEGLMDNKRIHELLVCAEKRGGLISHRRLENGEDQPYELNISWWSAMANDDVHTDDMQFERYILSQLFIMSLKGIPAFYLPTILCSENDYEMFSLTGQRRDLNRERFNIDKLAIKLKDLESFNSRSINNLNKYMNIRKQLIAFHPDSPMKCLSKDSSELIIIARGTGNEMIWAVHNVTNSEINLSLDKDLQINSKLEITPLINCLNDQKYLSCNIELKPYDVLWLKRLN